MICRNVPKAVCRDVTTNSFRIDRLFDNLNSLTKCIIQSFTSSLMNQNFYLNNLNKIFLLGLRRLRGLRMVYLVADQLIAVTDRSRPADLPQRSRVNFVDVLTGLVSFRSVRSNCETPTRDSKTDGTSREIDF